MYPFTTEGINDLIADLYALNDQQLAVEADASKSDFHAWLESKITFDDFQQDYFNNMPTEWFDANGPVFSTAIRFRRPVDFTKPDDINPNIYSSKIIKSDNTLNFTYNSVTGLQVSGSLGFSISLP